MIKESDIFSPGKGQAMIACRRHSCVFLTDDFYSAVVLTVEYRGSFRISGTVVDDDEFKIFKTLGKYGINGFL